MSKLITVVLEVRCWEGYGGEHYNGKLCGYLNEKLNFVELEHPLTRREALYLNKKENAMFGLYRPGDMSYKFETIEQLYRVAIKEWKKHFPDADILLEGEFACGSVQKCLAGPKKIKDKINKLFEEMEAVGWYEGSEQAARKIDNIYYKLIYE